MREFSTPLSGRLATTARAPGNLTDDVVRNADEAADEVGFSVRRGGVADGADLSWNDVTWAEFHARVVGVAKGLVAFYQKCGLPKLRSFLP